jgi:NhaP-type Na+/H+ or K+/H+ antiporter
VTVAAAVFAALVLGFAVTARWLSRVYVTAPITFVAAGAVISAVTPSMAADVTEFVKVLAEVTLALILFHDAAQVRPRQIEADRGSILRLLLVGLPLTVLIGFLAARVVFPAMPVMIALLLAAALSPTDAGLGAATVLNPVVPVRVRRTLNVESGLNDGLVTPVVLFAIAAAAGEEGLSAGASVVRGLFDLGVGAALGVVVGAGGGLVLGWSRRRGLSTPSTRSLGVLVLPVLAYCLVALMREQFRGGICRGHRVHRGGALGR